MATTTKNLEIKITAKADQATANLKQLSEAAKAAGVTITESHIRASKASARYAQTLTVSAKKAEDFISFYKRLQDTKGFNVLSKQAEQYLAIVYDVEKAQQAVLVSQRETAKARTTASAKALASEEKQTLLTKKRAFNYTLWWEKALTAKQVAEQRKLNF